MTPTLPKRFTISCTADDAPAARLMILVHLRMRRKNPHTAVVGPTHANGEETVSGVELKREADAAVELFPTDYEPLDSPDGFAGEIEVRPMTLDQLGAAIRAFDLYSQVPGSAHYPKGHRKKLTDGLASLVALNPRRLEVRVTSVEPSDTPVRFIADSVPYPAALWIPSVA
jgi:hypothetical protein